MRRFIGRRTIGISPQHRSANVLTKLIFGDEFFTLSPTRVFTFPSPNCVGRHVVYVFETASGEVYAELPGFCPNCGQLFATAVAEGPTLSQEVIELLFG